MAVLELVRKELDGAKKDVKIEGKTLRHANVEQPAMFGYYDEIRVHLQSLSEYLALRVAEQRAKVLKYITENSSYEYGERLKEKLVEDDPQYIKLALDKLEVDEVLEIAKSICKQFDQRGYTLGHISRLVVAQAEDDSLIMNTDDQ